MADQIQAQPACLPHLLPVLLIGGGIIIAFAAAAIVSAGLLTGRSAC